MPTGRLSTFDNRFTEHHINSNPDRWYFNQPPGIIRLWAAKARSLPMPPIFIPPDLRDMVVLHNPTRTSLIEGRPSKSIYRVVDKASNEHHRNYYRTADYFSSHAHPLTFKLPLRHPDRTVIWILRMNTAATADNLRKMNIDRPAYAGDTCSCMMEEESIAHMLLECNNYVFLRRWPTEKGPFAHNDLRILRALGFIKEIPPRPDGTHKGNVKQAGKNMDAAVKIWRERCKLEKEFRKLCQTMEDHDIAAVIQAAMSDSE